MIEFYTEYLYVLIALIICIALAIIRVVKGPTAPDRVVGLEGREYLLRVLGTYRLGVSLR